MLIDKDAYEFYFRGYSVSDATVRDRSMFYFVLLSEYSDEEAPPADGERTTRIVSCFLDEPVSKRWGYASYRGLEGLYAGATQRPEGQFVGVDMDGKVLAIGSGAKGLEPRIAASRTGPLRGAVNKTRTLDGRLHVCTGYRGFARRDARQQWTSLCTELDFQPDPDLTSAEYGFEDFDAFGANDYYCVGGKGDVWHFDGTRWARIDFPSNMPLDAVCCAGDGWVYIGGSGGSVWKGREDTWKLIHSDDMTLPFKDMVWFQDRVYCTSDYGLWELVGDELLECAVPPAVKICSGNLSVADGVMLLAGVHGAAYHDGRVWTSLFDTGAF